MAFNEAPKTQTSNRQGQDCIITDLAKSQEEQKDRQVPQAEEGMSNVVKQSQSEE